MWCVFKERVCVSCPQTLLLVVLVVVSLQETRGQVTDAKLEAFVEAQEKIVFDVAKYAEELHRNRVKLVRKCECSKHACSSDFADATCVDDLGLAGDLCQVRGKRRLDLETSIFRLPPGTDPDNLSNSLKESICVYRHIEDKAKEFGEDVYSGVYMGTLDGHSRKFPGFPRERCLEGGEPKLNGCRPFDPRLRPWFIAASTGPKDIVIVVDKSISMQDFVNSKQTTKWHLVTEAVNGILDTLTFTDYANIVTFSDDATRLWNQSGLAQATAKNLEKLKRKLSKVEPSGQTNFTAAFETAFRLLQEDCDIEHANCTNCQKIVLFLTDGRDTSQENGKSVKPSSMHKRIQELQSDLETATQVRAVIFTFSISNEADDAIPRQIACANDGAWAFIGPNTKTLDALNSYFLYMSAGRRTESPIWMEPYEDDGGLGSVTTVAMPFYAKGTKSVPDVFLGVVGKDVLLNELESDGTDGETVLRDTLVERSKKCSFVHDTPCELQFYRHAHDERSLCVDPYPTTQKRTGAKKNSSGVCYEFGGRFYRRFIKQVSWKSAKANCNRSGGRLVSIADAEELGFVASLAALDGSWVGAERTPTHSFEWLNKTLPDVKEDSDFWGIQEPSYRPPNKNCAAIDRRGAVGNMLAKSCDEELSFICVYEMAGHCGDRIRKVPWRGYFKVPPLTACLKTAKVLATTRPEYREVKQRTSSDVMCDLGSPVLSNRAVICCDPGDIPGYPNEICTPP